MPAGIEEYVDFTRSVAAQDHGFLAHPRDKEITGIGNLALMPDQQPRTGKDAFQLLLVDLVIDKDLTAETVRW